MPLRIGVNALYLLPGKVGGTEIYLRNVLHALAACDRDNQYLIFRNAETGPGLTPPQLNFHDCPQYVKAAARPLRILYEQTILPLMTTAKHIDVLFNAGFTAPLLCACPMITVIHDLQYKRHPEYFRWFDLPFWRVLLPASAVRSQRIVTLSDAVRDDVERFYKIPRARIDVIPHAVESEFERIAGLRESAPPKSRIILTVSTLHPHKNLNTLLIAFRRFIETHPGWRLVIVGLKGFEEESIETLRRSLDLEQAVTITGWIAREELYALFTNANAFVYPSRFEGFGIPVLEALTAGIPVCCSRIPSLVEIAGDSVRYFDPDNANDITAALTEVTQDEAFRLKLRQAGVLRATRFSIANTGAALVAAFNKTYDATRAKNSHD